MTNHERLMRALFHQEGRQHLDLKFFRGFDPGVTADQLCNQAANAFFEIDHGIVVGDQDFKENLTFNDVKVVPGGL